MKVTEEMTKYLLLWIVSRISKQTRIETTRDSVLADYDYAVFNSVHKLFIQ